MEKEELKKISTLISLANAYICSKPEIPCNITKYLSPSIIKVLPDKKNEVTLETIYQKIKNCKRCPLSLTRKNSILGVGVEHPLVVIVGEGPGEEEESQCLPFTGKKEQLLIKMLAAIKLSSNENCYICNIVKCKSSKKRFLPEEITACKSFFDAQIHILKPALILTLGNIVTNNLLNIKDDISRIHGHFFDFNGIPLMPTYHPSELLENETLKRPAWEDLKLFRTKLEEITGHSFGGK